jgi:hypothetical protein
MNSSSDDLLPDSAVARRYDVHLRSLARWDRNPTLGFPAPIQINGRKYRRRSELEEFERRNVAKRPAGVAR